MKPQYKNLNQYVFQRGIHPNSPYLKPDILYNKNLVQTLTETAEIPLKLDKVKYANWNNESNFLSVVAELGYYDIINVYKKKSIYNDVLSNELRHVYDIKFLLDNNDSKVIISDCESVRLFDVNYPHIHEKLISDLMIGYNKITLNLHDPNLFIFQFSDSFFTYFDIRQKYNLNLFYYPILTEISETVDHCDISPTRPYELAICYLYQKIALYDIRMISPGIPNTIPSKGIVGIMEPFYDFKRPIVTSMEYKNDGSEIIAMDYSGYTKILSCDPHPSLRMKTSQSKTRFYSRTSYTGLNPSINYDLELKLYNATVLNKLKTRIRETTSENHSNGCIYTPVGFNHNWISLQTFLPKYEERVMIPNSGYRANKSLLWGEKCVLISNKSNRFIHIWDRIEQKFMSSIEIGGINRISYISKSAKQPVISAICDENRLKFISYLRPNNTTHLTC